MMEVVLLIGLAVVLCYFFSRRKNPLNDIPGPKPYPLVGNALQLDVSKIFIQLTDMGKQFGGLFKVHLFTNPVVVVTDYHLIHDVLVKHTADFAGRPYSYRAKIIADNVLSVGFTDAGPEHRGRRKVMHSYLKQFGSGLQKIEDVTQTATDDLVKRLAEQDGKSLDIREYLVQCVADVTMIMLMGETISAEEIKAIRAAMDLGLEAAGPGKGMILDMFPFVRFMGESTYKTLQMQIRVKDERIGKWMDNKPSDGYINFLQAMSEDDKKHAFLDSKRVQYNSVWEILVAGVYTTSTTLTFLMSVLCHYPDVQEKLRQEVLTVIGPSRRPTLRDQDDMPYIKATLLEIGRFASILPLGVPHKAVRECTLGEYTIPKDTPIWINMWAMHHDEKLWDEPFEFRPERFLDADGQLVAADHPNRLHAMPFGAGHRVCVGEVFARSRMFLIMARIMQNFTVLPETTMDKQPSCDSRDMKMGFVARPCEFQVRMAPVLTE